MMQKTLQRLRHFRTLCLRTMRLAALGLATSILVTTPVRGQDAPSKKPVAAEPTTQPSEPPTSRTHPNQPMLWDVDQMMEDAVMQITRRYNLSKPQENYTRLLLTERVREFLDNYETDVRDLLQQSIDMRTNRADNSPQALMEWASRAAPLYEAAKNAILDGNEEWGEILDVDQKNIHDQDLALMRTNFDNVARTLDTWMEGKGKMPGGTVTSPDGNGTLARHDNRVSNPVPSVTTSLIEENWMAYVSQFIAAYKLDDKQQVAARDKIHKEQFDRARQYRQKEKKKFEEISKLLAQGGGKLTPVELNRRNRELEEPIRSLFVELDRRLQTLPNSEQTANVDPELKKRLEANYKVLAGLVSEPSAPGKQETRLKPDKPDKPADADGRKPKQAASSQPDSDAPAPKATSPAPEKDEKSPNAE